MDRSDLWKEYVPSKSMPWNLRRVVHLHRRAGFGASWAEIQRDLSDGPSKSIGRLLEARSNDGYEAVSNRLAASAVRSNDSQILATWWCHRMLLSGDPLTEKLTLHWHSHFATSSDKVTDLSLMHRQNRTLRKSSRGPFGALLENAMKDPALLLYLDAPSNRKGHPNENLAREAMELFALGVGRFSEQDVKEAARCLTGWTVIDGDFVERSARHDSGEKTLFGKRGNYTGSDFVRLLVDHRRTPERVASRLVGLFFGEQGCSLEMMTSLSQFLKENRLDIGRACERILRSQAFFEDGNIGTRISSPVEYVLGSVRALERSEHAVGSMVLADWVGRMGQELFRPPNVGGWPGGRTWLDTRSLATRCNFADALVGSGFDASALPKRHGVGDPLTFYCQLLWGRAPTDPERAVLDKSPNPVEVVLTAPMGHLI